MNHGRIIACGPVAEIKQHIPARQKVHLHVRHLPAQALDGLRAIPGVVQLQWSTGNPSGMDLALVLADEKESLPPVMRFIVSHGGDVQHCHVQGLTLEEAFVHLVEEDRHGV
jgi:ABC-type multidrug transport system ATPase subunit